MSDQTSFLGIPLTDIPVKDTCRKIMQERPLTYGSDRLFMMELFSRFVPGYKDLPKESREALEELSSKDFMRRRQDIRKEDGKNIPGLKVKEVEETLEFDECIEKVAPCVPRGRKAASFQRCKVGHAE